MTALASRAFENKRLWLYLVGIVLVGGLFEAVQYGMPSRTFNWYDVVANGVGVVFFVVIWVMIYGRTGNVRTLEG